MPQARVVQVVQVVPRELRLLQDPQQPQLGPNSPDLDPLHIDPSLWQEVARHRLLPGCQQVTASTLTEQRRLLALPAPLMWLRSLTTVLVHSTMVEGEIIHENDLKRHQQSHPQATFHIPRWQHCGTITKWWL